MSFFWTVEKNELNTKMFEQLKSFMGEEKIINILDCENYIPEDAFPDFSAFQLKSLLGKRNYGIAQEQSNMMKVRILNFSSATWNAIRTICQACQADTQIDILVISHPYDIFSNIQDCRRYCKLIVVASMQLVRYAHNWTSFF